MKGEVTFRAIGVVQSPFREKADAPRQPEDASATIELFQGHGYEHALSDLEGFRYIWVLFVFDRAEGFKAKVLPPRSEVKRGLFATRSPHRPNPIGMSCVELVSVEGLTLRIRGADMLDGTPVLDIKPYVAYADAREGARMGWLEASRDPKPAWRVVFSRSCAAQLDWLEENGAPLRDRLEKSLALGPTPHPYRRIKRDGDGFRIAVKEWRAWFEVADGTIVVERIGSGYRSRDLATSTDPALDVHRRYVHIFATNADPRAAR